MTLCWPWPILQQGQLWSTLVDTYNIDLMKSEEYFKLDFVRNHFTNQSQILYMVFLGRENQSLYKWSGHMTKMAAMPIYGKNLKNQLLWNCWTDFNKAWYVASGTLVHHSLYKSWPWVDLHLFYGKVNIGLIGFSMEKSENIGFFRKFCGLWPESW